MRQLRLIFAASCLVAWVGGFSRTGLKVTCTVCSRTTRWMATTDSSSKRPLNKITSSSNAKIKTIKSLKMKKKRDALQLVVLEGYRHIMDALDHGLRPNSILLTRDAYESTQGLTLSTVADEQSLPLEMVDDSIFKKELSDTISSQGMVAIFEKPAKKTEIEIEFSSSSNKAPLIVVMDQLADPGNVGTIIRTCYGLGVDAVINIEGGCDYWNPKVLRSAMGLCLQTKNMPMLELDWDSAHRSIYNAYCAYADHVLSSNKTTDTNDREQTAPKKLQILLADGSASSISHHEVDFERPTVVVVGNEAWGVSDSASQLEGKDLEAVTDVIRVKINMTRNLESFNAAVAGM